MADQSAAFARQLLDKVKEIDRATQRGYYEIGQILSSLRKDQLFKLIGYGSFAELIEEELTFAPGTAFTYMYAYRRFRELKFTKTEAIHALEQHGSRAMAIWLRKAKNKVTATTLAKHIKKQKEEQRQVTFWLKGDDYARAMAVLEAHGATRTEQGYHQNTTEAFLSVIEEARGTKRAA